MFTRNAGHEPPPLARARVGQILRGKWHLDSLIGAGGMASVYAATHRNGKRGAVKILHHELSADENARTRFLQEGYAANKVDHPGAVSVLDDDVDDDGCVFLVMELLDGESADARARQRPGERLEIAEVAQLGDQLLDVLAAAHDKGIVHRDIKPENIFLTRDGGLKVLDFGIARVREVSGTASAKLTADGGPMGTPAFMPPEQALGNWDEVGPRTDIWAVGATMFTLLSGRCVHAAETMNQLLLAAMTKPAPPIASLVPGLPLRPRGGDRSRAGLQRREALARRARHGAGAAGDPPSADRRGPAGASDAPVAGGHAAAAAIAERRLGPGPVDGGARLERSPDATPRRRARRYLAAAAAAVAVSAAAVTTFVLLRADSSRAPVSAVATLSSSVNVVAAAVTAAAPTVAPAPSVELSASASSAVIVAPSIPSGRPAASAGKAVRPPPTVKTSEGCRSAREVLNPLSKARS